VTSDLRLTRVFREPSAVRISLMVEAFNLFNAANLTQFNGNLLSASFGQPATRFSQVFGSGGPRAFQLGVRASY